MVKVKELRRALGVLALGVIGRVTPWNEGKTIIETGKGVESGSWEKTGHIVLTPDEREELIEALESHRDYHVIELGDSVTVSGERYEVAAVQYLNATADGGRLRGTILAYCERKREWAVLTADPYGEVHHGTYTQDSQRALNAYITRVNEHLYTHFNASPPSITFGHVAERDKLTTDA